MKKIYDFIRVYPKIIKPELCRYVIQETKCKSQKLIAETNAGVNKSSRNCFNYLITGNSKLYDLDKEIFNSYEKVLNNYINDYPEIYQPGINMQDTGYLLLEYNKGQYYKKHVDGYSRQRLLTSSILLSNENSFEGGEFNILGRNYKLNQGDALIFPSNFMYEHEIKIVTEGTRHALITWFG